MAKNLKLSIIIVNYRAQTYLFNCLKSIFSSSGQIDFEVLVVDNDQEKTLARLLTQAYPLVKYIRSVRNLGFGSACNLGAKSARGEFLFFLNPDTIVLPETIDRLVDFLEERDEAGIVAPVLVDEKRNYYPLQVGKLTPLTGMVALSFLNKYFPHNPISRHYWLKSWDKKEVKEVETAPGTAFLIRRQIFEKIGGFDDNFFLFFEEMDLCLRVRKAGWQIFIDPWAEIIHFQGKSTPGTPAIKKIFKQSRFYYFKKHWGFFVALIVESFLRSGEWLASWF